MKKLFGVAAALLVIGPAGFFGAEATIEDTNATKYAYGANIGWINMRPNESSDNPTPNADGGDGATVRSTYIQGRVYSANCGWITLGDVDGPVNGHTYANNSDTDYGVNIENGNQLVGYAYGANIGWINFGNNYPIGTSADEMPQIDLKTGELSGYAYGANIGWINLGHSDADAGTYDFNVVTEFIERPDDDNDSIDDTWEMAKAGNKTTLSDGGKDSDGDGEPDVAEYAANTNPLSIHDRFQITDFVLSANNQNTDITFTSNPARCYQLVYKNDLGDANWTDYGSEMIGNLGSTTINNVPTGYTGAVGDMRHFRVETAAPLRKTP